MRALRVDPEDDTSDLVYPASISDGELLFNLGYDDGFAGGAYACGRCHTTGWSEKDKSLDGSGALGPSLRDGAKRLRFPGSVQGPIQQTDFICQGSENGKLYGANGQGTGRMPGFCQTPEIISESTHFEVAVKTKEASNPDEVGGMLSKEQVEAIVEYERGL